jgi:DNA-binding NtrC family response regulator
MLAEAPDDLEAYVRGFVSDKLEDPELVESFTERVTAVVRASAPEYPWPGNLRELRNYTNRALLGDFRPPTLHPGECLGALAVPVESTALPSSGILGPVAKEGRVSVDELTRSYVTRVHVLAGENTAETARRTGLDRRTVARWLDPARLRRWLSRKG